MWELANRTPFDAAFVPFQDAEGWDGLAVVVKATLGIGSSGALAVADEQVPLCKADVPYGEPGVSSVRYESDLCPGKPGCDVVLNGHAYPPGGRAAAAVDVELRVGSLRAVARVFGDRVYYRSFGSWAISDPTPFSSMPLRYERAYGGVDETVGAEGAHPFEERNPVGTGFCAPRSSRNLEGVRLPNLEDPGELINGPDARPKPVGFGFVGRDWLPRRRYAGTYDEHWQRERKPLLPEDFDPRFHQGAQPSLQSARPLRGGERVRVTGAVPGGGTLELVLPAARPELALEARGGTQRYEPLLDTLVIEPDEHRVLLCWRASVRWGRELLAIDRILVTGGPS